MNTTGVNNEQTSGNCGIGRLQLGRMALWPLGSLAATEWAAISGLYDSPTERSSRPVIVINRAPAWTYTDDPLRGSGASADFRPNEGSRRADEGISQNIDTHNINNLETDDMSTDRACGRE